MSAPLRVAQCYTGGVGAEVLRRLARHPRMTPVAVLVHDEHKAGRDAGELAGVGPLGVIATRDVSDVIAAAPQAAVWSARYYEPAPIAELLGAGINVYTGLGTHFLDNQPERDYLEEACQRGGSSLAAGGNIPGLISDVLPLFLSGFTGQVRHLTAYQRNHVAHYPSAVQVAGLGIGRPAGSPEDQLGGPVDLAWEWLIGMSASMVAAGLGIPFSRLVTRDKQMPVATTAVTLPGSGLHIEAGQVAGVRWTWDAYSGDHVFLTVVNELTAVYGLGPDWRRNDDTAAWTVTIDGSPPLQATLTWPEGTVAAEANAMLNAARAVNFLPALVAAPAGCRSVLDLPMITCTDSNW